MVTFITKSFKIALQTFNVKLLISCHFGLYIFHILFNLLCIPDMLLNVGRGGHNIDKHLLI